MTAVYPSATNVFIPDHAASGKMVVDFARNPKDFPVNEYIQVVPSDKISGYYLEMTVEEAGRIQDTDLDNFVWYDGDIAPEGRDGQESHNFQPYTAVRRTFPVPLGNMTIENASWDIKNHHASIKARQAMTARTQAVANLMTTAATYPTAHQVDVTALTGHLGNWVQSTTSRREIHRSINHGIKLIQKATLSAVKPSDLRLVIPSELAAGMAECQEITDYIKGSPMAWAQIRGDLPNSDMNRAFGLPKQLYGVELVVEDTYKVSSKKGASTTTRTQVWPTTVAVLCSRPGGLVGVAGAPSFSTFTVFAYKGNEMLVEIKEDVDNKRVIIRVIDTVVVKATAPASGVIFTACQ